MTYIPRREITRLIPNKFEAIRVLALECRRLNDEFRAREDHEVEGKLTTLAVEQMLSGKVSYYDAKERREQERSEAMLSAAEGLLDMEDAMMTDDFDMAVDAGAVEEPVEGTEGTEGTAAEPAGEGAEASAEAPVDEAAAEATTDAPVEEATTDAPVEEATEATQATEATEPAAESATEPAAATEETVEVAAPTPDEGEPEATTEA